MVDLGIGDACNSSCIMCTSLRPEDRQVKNSMLTMEEIEGILDSVVDPEYIAITGGEPTLRKDLLQIVRMIQERFPKTEIKLLTNGRLLCYEDYGRLLVDSGIQKFIVPLHAHHPDLHDFIARSKGSFGQTLQGIRNLQKLGADFELRIVIHGINYPFLPETAELIKKEFGSVPVVFLYFDIIGSASANKDRLIVPMTKVVRHLEKAIDTLEGKNLQVYHFPLCVLRSPYQKYVRGITVVERRITFADQCKVCREKSGCCGIWQTYAAQLGTKEFKAIQ